MPRIMMAALVLALGLPLTAAAQDDGAVARAMARCQAMPSDAQRLACMDGVAAILEDVAPGASTPALPPRAEDPLNRPIWIEGGTFEMGGGDGGGTHQVTLSGFWIQEHEVTNEEYRRFDRSHSFPAGAERYPVTGVFWQQAMDYAAWRRGSLPTEAQWEFAARGTEGRTYPWGNAPEDQTRANYWNDNPGPMPVGSYPAGATPEGVHDLAGNVRELVRDGYAPYPSGAVTDPMVPMPTDPMTARRIVRGGDWASGPIWIRADWRDVTPAFNPPWNRTEGPNGFRVAWPGLELR